MKTENTSTHLFGNSKLVLPYVIFSLVVFMLTGSLNAQTTFTMAFKGDTTINNCDGIIVDNGGTGNYMPLANDTFRVCTGGMINIKFNQFSTEGGWDSLYVYDSNGPNSSNLIGAYSGTVTPANLVANSGCFTLVFKSSATIELAGFEIEYESTLDTSVTNSSSVLTANANGGPTYQWVRCDSGYTHVNGAIARTFTTTSTGTFAVILTQNGCSDTSGCHTISGITSINNPSLNSIDAKIVPNPNTGAFLFKTNGEQTNINIYSLKGTLVKSYSLQGVSQINLNTELSKGLYLVEVSNEVGYRQVLKLSIQ